MLTPASLDYLRHLAVSAGILLALVAFILFQATAPRYSRIPRLSATQARRAWALFGLLVLAALLVVVVLWWVD
jgi:O-antigen/teichoic acid export membrane protein